MKETRELNRLRYLAAMGISPLVSRRELPGAKASRKLMLKAAPAAPAAVSRGTDAAPSPSREAGAGARLAAELRKTDAPGQSPRAARVAPPPSPAPSAGAAERFRIAVLFAGDRLWLEELGEEVLARAQVDLVAAIVAALSHPQMPDTRPDVRQFDWPLHGNAQLDLGADEAASALEGFLSRQVSEREPAEIVCLGSDAAFRLRRLNVGCTFRELPSTREMLAEPLTKRRAWHALRS